MKTTIQSTVVTAAVLLACGNLVVAVADGSNPPPIDSVNGIGAAQLGENREAVKKALPAMQNLAPGQKLASAVFSSPHLERFIVRDHKVEGHTKPVDVELRFWRDKLWALIVYFSKEDTSAVLASLKARYGAFTNGAEDRPVWEGKLVTLQAYGPQAWYGLTLNSISEDARTWFFKALTGKSDEKPNAQAGAADSSSVPKDTHPAAGQALPGTAAGSKQGN